MSKKKLSFPQPSQYRENSTDIIEASSQFIPWRHKFLEQFENMAQTWKLADGWKCKDKILMRALPSYLKADGKYFMPFSAGLQVPGTISEIFFVFSKKLTLFYDISWYPNLAQLSHFTQWILKLHGSKTTLNHHNNAIFLLSNIFVMLEQSYIDFR